MIIYSKLGSKGNLGNHLFQIASTIGIATRNDQDFGFSEWVFAKNFNKELPSYDATIEYERVNEKNFHYSDLVLKQGQYDLHGWFQSEKYFNIDKTKKYLKFRDEIIEEVKRKYKDILLKRNILISVRRGDFVHNPYYFQLDYKYYFLAITTQFPDWQTCNLIFTSDNINYCKKHFNFLQNAVFIEKSSAIEQLVLGSLCDDFVISNSTFSWWQAWLGEKEESKIIRPIHNLRGDFGIKNDDKDYFPDRWIPFDSESEKIGFKNSSLVLKGRFYKFLDLMHFGYKFYKKKAKKIVKKLIGRN